MPQAKNKNHNQAEAKSKTKLPPSSAASSVSAPPPISSDQNSTTQLVSQGVCSVGTSANSEKIKLQSKADHQKPQQNSLLEQPEQSQIQVVRQDLVLEDDEPSEVSQFLTLDCSFGFYFYVERVN